MAPILQRPAYSAGSISVTAGGVVTGVGTNFVSPDGTPGWTISRGDQLFCAGGTGWVDTITDATHLTLQSYTGGAVAAGAAYRIDRNSGLPNSAVAGLVQALLARGGDVDPFGNLVIDGGTTRLRIKNAADGSGVLQTRLSSLTDAAYVDAIKWASDGTMTLPSKQLHGLLPGTVAGDAATVSQIPLIKGGVIYVTTDASGYAGYVYPAAFPNKTDTVVVSNGYAQAYPNLAIEVYYVAAPAPAGYFTIRAVNSTTGDPIASSGVVFNYIAFGS